MLLRGSSSSFLALATLLALCLQQADPTLAYTGSSASSGAGGGMGKNGGGHIHTQTHKHTHDAASSTTSRRGGATGMPGWIQGLKPVARVGVWFMYVCVCACV